MAAASASWSGWLAEGLDQLVKVPSDVAAALSAAAVGAADYRFPSAEGLYVVREEARLGHLGGTASRARCTAGSGREFDLRRLRVAPAGGGGGLVALSAVEALSREVELALEAGQHPNVQRCHAALVENCGEAHCRLLLCEPCVGDLALHLAASTSGALPAAEVADVGQQLALGLGHLHALGNLQGGPVPDGVLRGQDGLWKLADFSRGALLPVSLAEWRARRGGGELSERADEVPPEARGGGVVGEDATVTRAADVWLLGLLLARLLLGGALTLAGGGGGGPLPPPGLALAAAPAALLEDAMLARLWLLLHWLLAEDLRDRPLANEAASLLGAVTQTPPQELLEELPPRARLDCRGAAAAAARQLAVDEAAAAATAASAAEHGRLVSRLAALPLAELRQELADPSRVDRLCANCGLRQGALEATDGPPSPTPSEPSPPQSPAASADAALAAAAAALAAPWAAVWDEDKPAGAGADAGASTDTGSTSSVGSAGSAGCADVGPAELRGHQRSLLEWEGNPFAVGSPFVEEEMALAQQKLEAAPRDDLIDIGQADLIDLA